LSRHGIGRILFARVNASNQLVEGGTGLLAGEQPTPVFLTRVIERAQVGVVGDIVFSIVVAAVLRFVNSAREKSECDICAQRAGRYSHWIDKDIRVRFV
jgi:polyferredoxin